MYSPVQSQSSTAPTCLVVFICLHHALVCASHILFHVFLLCTLHSQNNSTFKANRHAHTYKHMHTCMHTHRHTQAHTHTHTISKQFTIHQQQKLSMQDIHEHKTCFSHILRLLSYFSDSKFPWLNQLMWSWGSHILPESTFHSSLLQSNDWAWLTVLGTEHPTPLMFNTWAEGGK